MFRNRVNWFDIRKEIGLLWDVDIKISMLNLFKIDCNLENFSREIGNDFIYV